jgi:hypothetical protein
MTLPLLSEKKDGNLTLSNMTRYKMWSSFVKTTRIINEIYLKQ